MGYDWEDCDTAVDSHLDRFVWEDTGYPELEKFLEEENRRSEEGNRARSDETIRRMREEHDETKDGCYYQVEDRLYLERTDSRIFGFMKQRLDQEEEMLDMRIRSYNILPETGERLFLEDFVKDYDALAERIVKGIREIYQEPYQKAGEERPFNEAEAREYILDALETIDDEENLHTLGWVLDEQGLLFCLFNPPDVGARDLSYVPLRVQIPYHELDEMLEQEFFDYTALPQNYITSILPYTEYVLESGGEEIRLYVELVKEKVEGYEHDFVYDKGAVNITVNENRLETDNEEFDMTPDKVVLVKKEEEFYLYMDFYCESYDEIRSYRITPDGAQELKTVEGGFAYSPTVIDTVPVEKVIWLYGTSFVYKNYRVDADGRLEDAGDETYRYHVCNRIRNRFPIEVDVFEDAFDTEASKETLPELTKLRRYRTDGENFVDFLTEDGRVIRLYRDQSFDGKSDYDTFYEIIYAG
ncbi:MAG: hypothetical protein Q4A19_02680 [Johnsonella sp.]|nr:hypothetical protein [Johnsonella sp.]